MASDEQSDRENDEYDDEMVIILMFDDDNAQNFSKLPLLCGLNILLLSTITW